MKFKRLYSWFFRLIFPGFSYCNICKMPWTLCKGDGHSVKYSSKNTIMFDQTGSSHFALCKTCWKKTTVKQRIKYYTKIDYIKNNKRNKNNIIYNILFESNKNPDNYLRNEKLKRINENI